VLFRSLTRGVRDQMVAEFQRGTGPGALVLSLKAGSFQQEDGAFIFAREFRRSTATPFTSEETFRAPAGKAILRIINGAGAQAATSAHITLNGKEIVGPADFRRETHIIDVPVELADANTVTARLDGKPGAKVVLLVKPRG